MADPNDGIDIPIEVQAGDAAEVADRVAASIAKLRAELDRLYKTQNSGDAKAAAAAAKAAQQQLRDELRASAINLANSRREQAAADRAAAKQQVDELKAAAINIRNIRRQAIAQEKADRAAAAADRRAATAAERAANKQLADEQKAAAINIRVLRQKAREQEKQAAAEEKAARAAQIAAARQAATQERERAANLRATIAAQTVANKKQEEARRMIDAQRAAVASLVRQLIVLASAYVGVRSIKAFIDEGLEFNETLETARLGVASLITSQTKMTTATGGVIDGTEKLAIAQGFAAEQVDKLRVAGLKSVATTEQLVVAFQQAVGIGLRWGLTLDQIRVLTVQMAQAAGALGVPLNQLNEEIRSMLTGTITPRNTRIATALGITNEQIKQAQRAGNLFEFVQKRLEAFSVAGEATARTFRGVMSNIKEALQNFAGVATKPLFESLRISGQEALEGIFDLNTAKISDKLSGILSLTQDIFGDVGDLISSALQSAVESAANLSKWLQQNTVQVHLLIGSFEAAAAEVGGLVHQVLSLIPGLAEAGVKSGILKNIFYGIGLVMADIRTMFDAILVAVGAIGVAVIAALVLPITVFIQLVGKAVGVFNKDLGASIEAVAKQGNDWVNGLAENLRNYSKNLDVGNTATERFSDKIQNLENNTVAAAAAQEKLNSALDSANRYQTAAEGQLLAKLEKKTITQKEYAEADRKVQLQSIEMQIRAQQEYLNTIAAENEGDRSRTRTLIEELIKRKNALKKDLALSAIAEPPAGKDSASRRAAGETALIKAELKNRLKDLKIELDNERLSYKDYYAKVTEAQQDAIDKQIAVQKRLLAATDDTGARDQILDRIKVLEGERTQVVEDNAEQQRQAEVKLAQEVTAAHVQLLKDQGRLTDARALEIQDKFKKLIARLKIEGDEAGAAIVEKLFNIDNAKTRLEELMNQGKIVQDTLATRLDAINTESTAHAITEEQARQKIVAAYRDAKKQLEAMLPAMRAAAALTEDPAQVNAVENLAIKIAQMDLTIRQTSDSWYKLKEAARESLQEGLTNMIDQSIEGAKSFADIWRSVAADVVASLRHVAAQMLATLIIQRTLGFFGGLVGGGGGTVTGGGTPVTAEAGVRVASGGYISGPGTPTSDSIPAWLSNGEFVIKADAVQAVGVDFLHAINNLGRAAVVPRRRTRGYAEGGVVSAGRGAEPGGFDATIGLEEGLVARHIRTRPGTDAVLNVLAANRNSVRRILGG